jgi:RimJ/RimL family protein N-acetyltransferase
MILKGKKTILRPVRLSDALRFVKWLSDSEVNKFTTGKKITLKQEKDWIKSLPNKKTEKIFAIDTYDKRHIGSTGLHLKPQNKNASFGIFIGDKNYWSSGYGTDAMGTIINYGFKKLKLHKISLDVYAYNPRAINLYLDLGFKLAGIKKEDKYYNKKFYDTYNMELLSKDWK